MINKQFSERINRELDNIGVPAKYEDRVKAVAKIFHINPFKARNILDGRFPKDDMNLLRNISQELEINLDSLTAKENSKKESEQE